MDTSGEKIAAIILGASEWPKFKGLHGSTSFQRSADKFELYLKSDLGLKIPQQNILTLFDRDDPLQVVDEKIRDFLRDRVTNAGIEDVIVYYCGHGSFTSDKKYMLILRSTRGDSIDITAYKTRDLAKSLNDAARLTRKWIILDSCSSAAAFGDLQPQSGEVINIIAEEAKSIFPSRATALLCASSADEIARAPKSTECTMFSGALLDVLKNGSANFGERLSLGEIHDLIADRIAELFQAEGIRPELYTPDQKQGDLSKILFFPNPAKQIVVLSRRLDEMENLFRKLETQTEVYESQIGERLKVVVSEISALESKFISSTQFAELSKKVLVLEEARDSMLEELRTASQKSANRQVRQLSQFHLPDEVWLTAPEWIRASVVSWHQANLNGFYLMGMAVLLLIISFMGTVLYTLDYLFTPFAPLPFVLFIFLMFGAIFGQRESASIQAAAAPSTSMEGSMDWSSYEVVIRALSETPINIFSFLKLERRFFLITMCVLFVACLLAFRNIPRLYLPL